MIYLSKNERKKQILDVAMRIALEDGLNVLTVRYLAQKAFLSVGLIHHHFKSIQDLKCEVFMQLVYKNLDMSDVDENLSLTEKILLILGFTKSEDELPYIRLWNDAEKNSQTSPEFNAVFLNALEEWQKVVKKILESAQLKNDEESLDNVAWQLIGLTLGLEGLAKFNSYLFSYEYMTQLVTHSIERVLSN